MIRKPASLLLILPVVLPALVACQAQPQTEGRGDSRSSEGSQLSAPAVPDAAPLTYRCESGLALTVTLDAGRSLHLDYDGEAQTLQSESAASGSAYKNARYRWVVNRGEHREQAELFRNGRLVETCSRPQVSAAPEPGMGPCRAEQMELRAGETDAAMGHRQQTFEISLKGNQPCVLPAWPVVHLEGKGDQPPPQLVRTRDSYFSNDDVQERQSLTSERAVKFYVGWSVIPDETVANGACPQVAALKVMAPGGGSMTPPVQEFSACGRGVVLSPFRPLAEGARKTD